MERCEYHYRERYCEIDGCEAFGETTLDGRKVCEPHQHEELMAFFDGVYDPSSEISKDAEYEKRETKLNSRKAVRKRRCAHGPCKYWPQDSGSDLCAGCRGQDSGTCKGRHCMQARDGR